MPYTIDIDTGGTFTDGLVCGAGRIEWVKADTTPHDFTVGFFNCIEEVSKKLGFENSRALLRQTRAIRFSTTIGTNAFIQRTGPKLGLIVSKGAGETLYSDGASPALDSLVPRNMVIGVKGKVDSRGEVTQPIDMEEVKTAIKELLLRGARVIVISLPGSPLNPMLEIESREIANNNYPPHYLGSVPMVLSTEISSSTNDAARTNAALLDAYMHRGLARFLYKAEEELADKGYVRPLLIVHNWGGVARVAKTKAISTLSSGPAAGLFGAAYVGKLYGIKDIVTIDIGGTSTDVGIVTQGKPIIKADFQLDGISVDMPIVETISLGAGGGSIATVSNKELAVGPGSAGAMPGPACFDLGGMEPTVTDACVVLGYINPNYFLGGKKRLSAPRAEEAIQEKVAHPLGISLEEAAHRVVKWQQALCAEYVNRVIRERGVDKKKAVMLSFGGAGGIHCGEIAWRVGLERVYIPFFAAVFSAFGSSTMDIAHEYETSLRVLLCTASGKFTSEVETINTVVDRLKEAAARDMRSEGFSSDEIMYSLELKLEATKPAFTSWIPVPTTTIESTEKVEAACQNLGEAYRSLRPSDPELLGEIKLVGMKLRAVSPIPHLDLLSFPQADKSPQAAVKGKRKVFWGQGFEETFIYEQMLLKHGNHVEGPAVIEGTDTTILVPSGSRYIVDRFNFGIMEKK